MFPLQKKTLIRGVAAHEKAGLGAGADYEAVYITDSVPFDGILKNYWGNEGGNWCRLTRPNGDKIEMAHHSKFLLKDGAVKEGQPMAITGNTGAITTNPHLHIQIFDKFGNRLDPEKYNWEERKTMKPQYIEQDGKIGFIFDYGAFSVIEWATDQAWGKDLTDHHKPEGTVLKIVQK